MKQELLMKPTVEELSESDKELITVAQSNVDDDPYYYERNGGFHPDVHAHLVGFYINRHTQEAFPVYKTDNGLFAVEHHIEERSVTSWAVEENRVYTTVMEKA